MKDFDKAYTLKSDPKTGSKWKEPSTYLGANLSKCQVPDKGWTLWSMSWNIYIPEAINTVEDKLSKSGRQLYKNTKSSIQSSFCPQLDASPVLSDDQSSYYLCSIGKFRWAVEIGCIDINPEIALISCYLIQPWCGHLDQAFCIFKYIKSHGRRKIVLDPH